MRLLIKLGYTDVLFAKGAEVGKLLEAFNGAKIVKEEGPYNARKYVPDVETSFDVRLIDDDCIALPEHSSELMDKLLALDKERTELQLKVYSLEKKLKDVGAAMGEPVKATASILEDLEDLPI